MKAYEGKLGIGRDSNHDDGLAHFVAAGLCTTEGTLDMPLLRQQVNVICDIMTGYLGAIGVKAAPLRRTKERGSYSVRVTLTQCIQHIVSLGLNDKLVIEDLEIR